MEYIYFLFVIAGLFLFVTFMSWPFKFIMKLIINSAIGLVLLLFFNLIFGQYNYTLGINLFTVIIAGFFGIPGIIFLFVLKFIV